MKKIIIITIVLLQFLFAGCSLLQDETKNVLLVHSYESGCEWYDDFNRLIAKELRREHIKADICTVYLNCEAYVGAVESRRMYSLLDSASAFKPDIIIVNDDQAAYSLLECNHPLPARIPVVFGGVNYPNYTLLEKYPNVTGVIDKIDFAGNHKFISSITGNNRVFIIADSTFIDLKTREALRKTLLKELNRHEKANRLPITKISEKNIDSLLHQRCIDGTIGFYRILEMKKGPYRSFSQQFWAFSKQGGSTNYLQTKRDFVVNGIARIINGLSFTAIYEAFGYGENIAGGYFSSMGIIAKEEAKLAARILKGESPDDIPIIESQKVAMLDWDVLEKSGYTAKDIDLNKYEVINITFDERHPYLFYSVISITAFLIILMIVFFTYTHSKETHRRLALADSLEKEKKLYTIATTGGNTYTWRYDSENFYFDESFFKSTNVYRREYITTPELLKHIDIADRKHIVDFIHKFSISNNNSTLQFMADFSGEMQWWEVRHTTMTSSDGSLSSIGIIINIQSLKNYEKELEGARDMAEKAELKQSFLANMSHEIRTPLNSIVGFSNILATSESLPAKERKECMEIINSNSQLLLKLVNDVLEIARIESGHMTFNIELLNVGEIVEEIFSANCILTPKNIEFKKEDGPSDLFINADRVRLSQVLNNFISNAFKFTSSGYVKIGLNDVPEMDEVEIYVEDTGIGIDKTGQKMIFARFFKRDEFAQGTGLGLSICKTIAEKLNGHIELSSELGVGSRFSIMLPKVRK